MSQPQPYNRRKRFFIEMSRTQLLISIAAVLFVISWVFILGIIVGRGIVADTITSTMKTQIQKLQQEKKALMEKYLGAEQEKSASSEPILKPQLDFYNSLSKKSPEPLVMKVPQPTLPPASVSPPEAKALPEALKAVEPKPVPAKPAEPVSGQAPLPTAASQKRPEAQKPPDPRTPAPRPGEPVLGRTPAAPSMEKRLPEPPKAAMAQTGDLMLQLGAYREEETAQAVMRSLSGKGYQAQVAVKDIPAKGGRWYRVRIGPFKTREETENMARRLTQDGFQSMIVGSKP